MVEFFSGKDVFVVLPTGFGKSLIYATLPLVYDSLLATRHSFVVVVSPLTAIMKDQVFSDYDIHRTLHNAQVRLHNRSEQVAYRHDTRPFLACEGAGPPD